MSIDPQKYQPGTPLGKAMASADVPDVLKDLCDRIIPKKLFDEFEQLVEQGVIDPLMTCGAFPLMSPVSQVMNDSDWKKWIPLLFSRNPEAATTAKCPWFYSSWRGVSTGIEFLSAEQVVATQTLVQFLDERRGLGTIEVLSLLPAAAEAPVEYNKVTLPYLHWRASKEALIGIETLTKLESITGGAGFLDIKDPLGQTWFYKLVTNVQSIENEYSLNAASWMLQRNPDLVNIPDIYGWTPLDRLVSRLMMSRATCECSMTRLLVASGGKLRRQVAPGFNMAAEMDKQRHELPLDKPRPNKPGLKIPKM